MLGLKLNHVSKRGPRDHFVVIIFPVQLVILHLWIAHPHEIVQAHGCCNDEADCGRVMWHCTEEHLEAVCQYSKGVFDDTPGPRQTVVEDSFLIAHSTHRVRLHHRLTKCEGVVSNDEKWHIFVVIREWLRSWKSNWIILDAFLEFRRVVDLSVGCCSFAYNNGEYE